MSTLQKTIEKEVVLEGAGIHTGKKARLVLLPAPADTGVTFLKGDLPQRPAVRAVLGNIVSTNRRTALASDGVRIETVEHFLASMFVLGIDNCLVEIDGPEVPALDGSALPYYNLLLKAGVRELDAPRGEVTVRSPVEVSSGEASIRMLPAKGLSVLYRLSFPQVALEQVIDFAIEPGTFAKEIAPARTFVLEEEIEGLRRAGYGKGADESNTVVVSPDGPRNEMRFPDEPARHKVLDLLGDLFFVGGELAGRIECERSGHALNRELVKALLKIPG